MDKKTYIGKISGASGLEKAESKYRRLDGIEGIPFAVGTSYKEIVEKILPDHDGIGENGNYKNPIYICESKHITTIGRRRLCNKTVEFLKKIGKEYPMDILSVSATLVDSRLSVVFLIRLYTNKVPKFSKLYDYLRESPLKQMSVKEPDTLTEQIVGSIRSKEEVDKLKEQEQLLLSSTIDKPFLNSIEVYIPSSKQDQKDEVWVYDLEKLNNERTVTNMAYEDFMRVFREVLLYATSVERDSYYDVLRGVSQEKDFMGLIEEYIERIFVKNSGRMPIEDVPAMLDKIYQALFRLYIVQDLIDDPDITDINITEPDSVRIRIKGKTYMSNVSFIDDKDYLRFVEGIYIRNNLDKSAPLQTFADKQDEDYILRFSITAAYVCMSDFPAIHIRKIPRLKLMAPDLIEAGMFDEKVRDYLIDCGKMSRGVVFAGPPGSGKTTCLNWFLEEAYEDSAEILVIQDQDELFSYRKGVIFEHVVQNPKKGERLCSMEDLTRMALVAGANVYVIGETKGPEICSAITLSNSGCRTAITIHSPSARETVDKMADYALRGYARTLEEAKRMIKSFQTIVYIRDFKIEEIMEIIGYDEQKKDMIYRPIYVR